MLAKTILALHHLNLGATPEGHLHLTVREGCYPKSMCAADLGADEAAQLRDALNAWLVTARRDPATARAPPAPDGGARAREYDVDLVAYRNRADPELHMLSQMRETLAQRGRDGWRLASAASGVGDETVLFWERLRGSGP